VELTWLRLVKASPAYARTWKRLRYAIVRYPSESDTPLIVFDPFPLTVGAFAYHVIGSDHCSVLSVLEVDDTQPVPPDGACHPPPVAIPGSAKYLHN